MENLLGRQLNYTVHTPVYDGPLDLLLDLIRAGQIKKGDVLTVAPIAGISASKRTSELIPLCHPLPLTKVDVDLVLDESIPGVVITATAKTIGKTGVEMEALTAVSVAALTVYDMAKAVEKTMRIQNIRLLEKHGGQSGDIYNPSDKEERKNENNQT